MLKGLKLDTTTEKNISKWLRGRYDEETKNLINKVKMQIIDIQ